MGYILVSFILKKGVLKVSKKTFKGAYMLADQDFVVKYQQHESTLKKCIRAFVTVSSACFSTVNWLHRLHHFITLNVSEYLLHKGICKISHAEENC